MPTTRKTAKMKRMLFLFSVVLNFLLSFPAAAQEMMILTEEYPPLSYSANGTITGASVEIVREILRRIDEPNTIKILPWACGYNLLKTKANVVLFSTTRTKERENLFHWVGPLCIARNGFYRKKGSGIRIFVENS